MHRQKTNIDVYMRVGPKSSGQVMGLNFFCLGQDE